MHVKALLFMICSAKTAFTNEIRKHEIAEVFQKGIGLLESTASLGEELKHLIFPGTKWCGPGDTASSYDDLGKFQDLDKCCRQHDSCTDWITAGQSKYGLTNPSFYTWVHCDCDLKFYKCLKNVRSMAADAIGFGYFTYLGGKCFKEDYPIVGCKKCKYTTLTYKKRNRKKCLEYDLDETGKKEFQLFDNPLYYY